MHVLLLTLSAIFVGMFGAIRLQRNKTLAIEYEYKLYALRDKLRLEYINRNIPQNSIAFDYLDHSISVLVDKLERLTLYKLFFLYEINKDRVDTEHEKFMDQIKIEVERNKSLKKIYREYSIIFYDFFKEKHHTTILIVGRLGTFLSMFKSMQDKIQKIVADAKTYPEISDDCSFAR